MRREAKSRGSAYVAFTAVALCASCDGSVPAAVGTSPGTAVERHGPDRLRPIALTLLDPDDRTRHGSFQSYNQKVVANGAGIFTTHLRSQNEAYTAQTWRLSRSTDGGRSFATLFEETAATNPPVLETDARGDLYLVRQDFTGSDAWLYVFRRADGYASHEEHAIPGGSSGKYAMVLDEARERLDYLAHGDGDLYTIDFAGRVRERVHLLREGERAVQQYPSLALDEEGALYAAWTNVERASGIYRSIHVLRAPWADRRWQRLDGLPVALPVAADESGAAERIVLDDELDAHTYLWSFLPRHGKLHFAYLAQTEPPRQVYVRYDLARGVEDLRVSPTWRAGEVELRGLDGFVVYDPLAPSTSYWIGRDGTRIAALRSDDDGASWHAHARSEPLRNPYAIGGFRRVTDDRRVIGTFTDCGEPNRVWFLSFDAD